MSSTNLSNTDTTENHKQLNVVETATTIKVDMGVGGGETQGVEKYLHQPQQPMLITVVNTKNSSTDSSNNHLLLNNNSGTLSTAASAESPKHHHQQQHSSASYTHIDPTTNAQSFNTRLIQDVRPRAALYDFNCDGYKFAEVRIGQWEEVATNGGQKVMFMKTRWKTLRDRFKKEFRRAQRNQAILWPHYKDMEFLIPFIRDRPPLLQDETPLLRAALRSSTRRGSCPSPRPPAPPPPAASSSVEAEEEEEELVPPNPVQQQKQQLIVRVEMAAKGESFVVGGGGTESQTLPTEQQRQQQSPLVENAETRDSKTLPMKSEKEVEQNTVSIDHSHRLDCSGASGSGCGGSNVGAVEALLELAQRPISTTASNNNSMIHNQVEQHKRSLISDPEQYQHDQAAMVPSKRSRVDGEEKGKDECEAQVFPFQMVPPPHTSASKPISTTSSTAAFSTSTGCTTTTMTMSKVDNSFSSSSAGSSMSGTVQQHLTTRVQQNDATNIVKNGQQQQQKQQMAPLLDDSDELEDELFCRIIKLKMRRLDGERKERAKARIMDILVDVQYGSGGLGTSSSNSTMTGTN